MVHHRDALTISENEVALLRFGIKPEAHGAAFREGAARINAVMGSNFVTTLSDKVSDKEYKQAALQKAFVLLITPLPNGKLGWNWAARLGPKAAGWVEDRVRRGSRLVQTSDPRWTRGRKIERFSAYSVPKEGEDATALQELYDRASL
jgi:hypothetical protein